jgi:hypothetical protein
VAVTQALAPLTLDGFCHSLTVSDLHMNSGLSRQDLYVNLVDSDHGRLFIWSGSISIVTEQTRPFVNTFFEDSVDSETHAVASIQKEL